MYAVIVNVSSIIACLTGRKKDSSKFSLSKSLITPFIKILHRQTFVPYSIGDCLILRYYFALNLQKFQMEVPLWLTCPEGDTGQEQSVDFLLLCMSFVCYVYSSELVWCFQIVSNVKHAKWKHIVANSI